jgi:FkbM family methyltransferase
MKFKEIVQFYGIALGLDVGASGVRALSRRTEFWNNPLLHIKALTRDRGVRAVLDVGAHEGKFSREMLRYFPHAVSHAFEPTPATFGRLKERLEGFGRRAVLNQKLVGAAVERRNFNLCEHSDMNSALPGCHHWGDSQGSIVVEQTSLDAYLAEVGLETVDVIKIDTQGYDLQVLEGASNLLSRKGGRVFVIEVLFVELYEGQCYFEEVYRFMKSHGYQLRALVNPHYGQADSMQFCDAIFV